jgi:hypothetical protein
MNEEPAACDGSSSRESRHRILEFISDQLEDSLMLRPIEIRVRAQFDVDKLKLFDAVGAPD